MKKQLQQELKNLATEILQQDENFSSAEMKRKITKIYEQLTILEYLEYQVSGAKSVANNQAEESYDSKSFREQNWFTEPEPIPQPQHKEDLVEPLMEKIKDLVAQMPAESSQVDELLQEVLPKKRYMKNDLEEFANTYQQTPTFERKVSTEQPPKTTSFEEREPSKGGEVAKTDKRLIDDLGVSKKPKSINDAANGLQIGLNDRLAYIKHLFSGNEKEYEETLQKINSLQSFKDAETYLKTKVKPQHNFWLQKDLFASRFMKTVEKKFQ